MNRLIFATMFFLVLGITSKAQEVQRTEEYAFLELSSHCTKKVLSITNNAKGTTKTATHQHKLSDLTDSERLLIAMNDLNGKGFRLKNSTVVADKCKSKRAFLFTKSRPKEGLEAKN